MICKNCDNDVMPVMSTGQIILGVILIIIGCVIFGVLYMAFCSKMICPVCKNNVYIKCVCKKRKINNKKNHILSIVSEIRNNIENIK